MYLNFYCAWWNIILTKVLFCMGKLSHGISISTVQGKMLHVSHFLLCMGKNITLYHNFYCTYTWENMGKYYMYHNFYFAWGNIILSQFSLCMGKCCIEHMYVHLYVCGRPEGDSERRNSLDFKYTQYHSCYPELQISGCHFRNISLIVKPKPMLWALKRTV